MYDICEPFVEYMLTLSCSIKHIVQMMTRTQTSLRISPPLLHLHIHTRIQDHGGSMTTTIEHPHLPDHPNPPTNLY